ncbi:MAG: DUF3987 domain-containing protein [Nitrospira sp.]|nr:MAG: DUF3987 domain-containing protein [Nitrospira sp.]
MTATARLDADTVREAARNRWPMIFSALCIEVGNGTHRACPSCGGTDRFRFDDQDGNGTWFCNQCTPQAGDGFALVRNVRGCDFPHALQLVADALGEHRTCPAVPTPKPARSNGTSHINIWETTTPDTGRIAAYLRNRGLSGVVPSSLRLHPSLEYWADGVASTYPAIVAAVVNIQGNITGIHRTWLAQNSNDKAPVLEAKKSLGALTGGTIRLVPQEPAKPLILSEGIETALACHEATGWPVWACVSAAGLEAVQLPAEAPTIYIAVDLDRSQTGEKLAAALARRLKTERRTVHLVTPRGPIPEDSKGTDWLDVFVRDGREAVKTAFERAMPWDHTQVPDMEEDEEDRPVPFPLENFPSALRDFITGTATSLPVPVDMIGVIVLVLAGAAIGATRRIRLKAGWEECSALYAAIVAPPGALKSPALAAAAAPVYGKQKQHNEEHERAQQQHEADMAQYVRDLSHYQKGQGSAPPIKPKPPTLERSWTGDTTVERLAGLLSENPRGVPIIRDELSAWVKSLNQYKSGKGSDKQFYLSAWNSAAIAVDRQGKTILIDHPFLSVVGCIPPDVLPDLDDESGREDGFLHRLLFTYLQPHPVRWTESVVSSSVKEAYTQLMAGLYALTMTDAGPVVLGLHPVAKTLFVKWHDEHCAKLEAPHLSPILKGFHAKLKGYAARFALIHALCENPRATEIPPESIAAACDLVDYFAGQCRLVAPLLVRTHLSPQEKCERDIRRALSGGQVLCKRTVQRAGNSKANVFKCAWDALVKDGTIYQAPDRAGYFRLAEAKGS